MLGGSCSPCCGCSPDALRQTWDELCASTVTIHIEGSWPRYDAYSESIRWIAQGAESNLALGDPLTGAPGGITGVIETPSPVGSHTLSLDLSPDRTFVAATSARATFVKNMAGVEMLLECGISAFAPNSASFLPWAEGSPCRIRSLVYVRTFRQGITFDFATAKTLGLQVTTLTGTDTIVPPPAGPSQQEIDAAIADATSRFDPSLYRNFQYGGTVPPYPVPPCPLGEKNHVLNRLNPEYISQAFVENRNPKGVFGLLNVNNCSLSQAFPTSDVQGWWDQSPVDLIAATEEQATSSNRFQINRLRLTGQMESADASFLLDTSGLGYVKGGSLGGVQGATAPPVITHWQWRPVDPSQSSVRTLNGVTVAPHPTVTSFIRSWDFLVSNERFSDIFGWVSGSGILYSSAHAPFTAGGTLAALIVDSSPVGIDRMPVPSSEFNITDFRVEIQ